MNKDQKIRELEKALLPFELAFQKAANDLPTNAPHDEWPIHMTVCYEHGKRAHDILYSSGPGQVPLIAKLHRQIDVHQSILNTHSVRPSEFHEGCIRGLIDAVSTIEQHKLSPEERLRINALANDTAETGLCLVMLLESRGYKVVRMADEQDQRTKGS